MSFTKIGDAGEVLGVIKTQGGREERLIKCAKCNGWHTAEDKCQAEKQDEEKQDEHAAKN